MPVDFNIHAQITAQVNPASLTTASAALRNAFQGVNANVGVNTAGATAGLQKVTSGAQASAAALRQMQSQAASTAATLNATVTVTNAGAASLRNLGEQAGLAARRFVAFSTAAGAIVTAVRGIQEGVRAAVEFQLSMNKVEQVSDEVSSKVGALRTEIGSLSTSLGVSSAALAETAITLKQAGLSVGQTKDALRALALTDLAPTFDGMKQSTEGLVAAFRQFNLTSGQFEQTLGSMNAVSAKFAVESSDIISAVQRAGGAFKLTAGDMKNGSDALNEFMALFTSVRATTRESADQIATGLRTVFTRFQRADTVKALADLGINLRYTADEAKALGNVNLRDQFVGAYEAVRRLSQGLEGLRETDPRYSQVVEQLGGYRQISRVVPLLKEFKTAEEAKNIAVAGGISLQLAAEKRQESLSNKIGKLKEEYLELFRKITESKSFTALANTMLSVASSFAKVLDFARPLLPLLTAFAAVKLGSNLGNIAGAFGRAFVAPPGALVSGPRAGAGAVRFASGGHVPGSGNTDTVSAVLTPGEFVVKKRSAERIGYHKLHALNERPERFADGGRVPKSAGAAETAEYVPALTSFPRPPKPFAPVPPSGRRKPLGPVTDDAFVQAMGILSERRFPRRFADGGRVTARVGGGAALQSVLDEFTRTTGISYRDLVSNVRLVSDLPYGGRQSRGTFNRDTRELLINRSRVKDLSQLRRTVFHELGHALDLRIGGEAYASEQKGTAAGAVARNYGRRLAGAGVARTDAYRAHITKPKEAFAEAVADAYAGAGAKGQSLLTADERGEFERRVVAPARAQINYGFIDPAFAAKRRATAAAPRGGVFGALLSGAAKLFGYADGGFVPGSGNNDTEPAMLMPGEFVLNKQAVAKMGVPALRDLNEGRSRFRIKRYAKGSTEPVGGLDDLRRQRVAAAFNLDLENKFQANYRGRFEGGVVPGGDRVYGASEAKVEKLTQQLAALNTSIQALERAATGTSAPATPPPAQSGRGQALLNRLKARQPAPRPTDLEDLAASSQIQSFSAEGVNPNEPRVKKPTEADTPFVSVAEQVRKDSEDRAEAEREKQARAFFDKQNGVEPEKPSYVSQLKGASAEQLAFFAKYTAETPIFRPGYDRKGNPTGDEFVGTKPGLARSVGEFHALKSGDIGRAGIASGVVEDAANEAVAQLAVAPPEGFDPKHPKAEGFVVRHVQNAVRNRLNTEYGSNGKRFGGYAPTDGEGKLIEQAGREADPASPTDYNANTASAEAHRTLRAQQLEQVRGVLPGGVIPTDRAGRLATLRALGQGKTEAVTNAAASRFDGVLAGHVADKLGVTPPGGPTKPTDGNFVGAAPGGGPKRLRDGTHTTPLSGIDDFAKSLGLGTTGAVNIRSQILAAAGTGGAGNLSAGLSSAALEVKNGQFARVAGLVNNASVNNPLSAQVKKFVDDFEKGVIDTLPPGLSGDLGGGKFVLTPQAKGLTDAEREYQNQQLGVAKQQRGRDFGVPGDELARRERVRKERRSRREGPSRLRAPGKLPDNVEGGVIGADLLINQRAAGVGLAEQYGGVLAERTRANNDRLRNAPTVERFLTRQEEGVRPTPRDLVVGAPDPVAQLRRDAEAASARFGGGEAGRQGYVRDRVASSIKGLGTAPGAADDALSLLSRGRAGGLLSEPQVQSLSAQFVKRFVATGGADQFAGSPEQHVAGQEFLARARQALPGEHLDRLTEEFKGRGVNLLSRVRPGGGGKSFDYDAFDETGAAVSASVRAADEAAAAKAIKDRGHFATRIGAGRADPIGILGLPQGAANDVALAEFTANPDESKTLSGGLLKERVDRRAAAAVAARGGEKNLSDGTRDTIRDRAESEEGASVRRELLSAQKNLLAKFQPEMTALERNRKALEDVEKAMQGLAKVSKDASGKFLGLSATVEQAKSAGIAAPGAGGPGYAVSAAVGGRLTAAREFLTNNKLTRLNERLSEYTQGPGFGIAAAGVGFAGSVGADYLDRRAGSAEDAAQSGSKAGAYTGYKAAGGALQGATLGAAVGAAGGPVGIAVGAVVGGLGGLYASLQDAAKDIRQAKINNALTELGDKLSAFATGLADPAALAGVRANVDAYKKNATERATEDSGRGLFSRFVSGDWASDTPGLDVDGEAYRESMRANTRKELGPLLPQIAQGLSKQAEQLGRRDAAGKPEDLLKELRDGGGGVNAEFLRIVAELRGVPVKQVEDEFRKVLVSAQQQKRVEDDRKAGKTVAEQQANTFGRLLQSVQAAADSLYGLQQRASSLADVLDGNVTASRVSSGAERLDEGLGRLDGGALKPLDIVAAATGEYGAKLRESGSGADAVARVLPGVLASAVGSKDLSEKTVAALVSDGIYKSLGYKEAKDARTASPRPSPRSWPGSGRPRTAAAGWAASPRRCAPTRRSSPRSC